MKQAIDEALALLPSRIGMASAQSARIILATIALQESEGKYRRQHGNGPARSLWQGELGGGMVHGVRTHAATRDAAAGLYKVRGVEPNDRAIWNAIEKDDVLAAGLARLLLYSDPLALPDVGKIDEAWKLYLRTWRPGAYTRGTEAYKEQLRKKFAENYKCAQQLLQP